MTSDEDFVGSDYGEDTTLVVVHQIVYSEFQYCYLDDVEH